MTPRPLAPSQTEPATRRRIARQAFSAALGVLLVLGCARAVHAESSISCSIADGFEFPVGKPNAEGYYKARGFWPGGHLGEDWNGRKGGNTDLGDPVTAMGNGVVVYSDDFKMGWGNVIIIRHAYREKNGRVYFVDSLYGHLDRRMARLYEKVSRGQQIGTIGRGPRNMYYAHLHFEVRKNLAIGMNRSKYPRDYSCYHSPTHFINANRNLRSEYRKVRIPVDTFLKTNPNALTAAQINAAGIPSTASGRPQAPAPVREVIRSRGEKEPEKDRRGFWSRLKARLRGGSGVDSSGE